ncbi:hypothetical protein CHS0354_016405 [Potamilus streckersoni]|uniref:Uncharacterized protein n=1 Tax=Potamilus streckersoni TaxID=2493646 RepID=A0AAE0SW36_9BIVA|nr:hypothetical protein CHS0354_016405 [Potamilus streckersoni]
MCCKHYEELQCKLESVSDCIAYCLNTDVLEVSLYEFLQANGPIDDEEPKHEVNRHIAYWHLASWIWHRLAKYDWYYQNVL